MVEKITIYAGAFAILFLFLIFSTENEKTTKIESFYHEPWKAAENITENDFIFESDICDPISKFIFSKIVCLLFYSFRNNSTFTKIEKRSNEFLFIRQLKLYLDKS